MAITGFFEHPGVIAMAHRGFSRAGLENSMEAFGAAVDLGYRYVETDVHATADGVCVAFHDDTLDRVTDGTGRLRELPWATVREAKIGGVAAIPRLDDLFEQWPDLRINIDCKHPSAIGPLVDAIERHRAHERVCVASFSDRTRRTVLRRLSAPAATSAGQTQIAAFVLASQARLGHLAATTLQGVDCIQVPPSHARIPIVTRATISAAHAASAQVHVWTIDEPSEMHALLDLGVDGILTDRADMLKNVLVQRNQWA
ncbi:glycerophosphodiester phosphodiesterase [Calidifontibacter sp. DB0510]|uniref:Glycerophosphodiester phosphodiesterase n=1 Tax=Metallococcus carri TaxID=1656884 RepID=A0A967EBG2_9MICO|nr:glycerophosphodiester phosphodiesterase [Metallococcus carri]NHN56914.1 glycerophosphodiester phosphodiesterase [Metallococcus carri]NOP37659.1 glycerophosphodiester phosphodiesterase [Calidifontibacter sp. DB2511S]